METKKLGKVEIRFFRGNKSVYIMYKEHKFFIDIDDVEDFLLTFSCIKENLSKKYDTETNSSSLSKQK